MFVTKPTRCKVKNLMTLQDDKKIRNVQYFSSLQSDTIVLYVGCHHILGSNVVVKLYLEVLLMQLKRQHLNGMIT